MKIGILGATGYTGIELLRLLQSHPDFTVSWISSESSAGQSLYSVFPQLQGAVDNHTFISLKEAVQKPVDGIFSCLPHKTAAEALLPFIDNSTAKIVDLSADFRMRSLDIYEKHYGPHPRPELLPGAVYGIPEWNAEQIATSRIIGNPGCYPTSILLPLQPLIAKGWVATTGIIADSKSGVSGAGKKPTETTHFGEVHESFSAYKIANEHRHLSELGEQLTIAAGEPVQLLFTPHLVPMMRGILSTVYAPLTQNVSKETVLDYLESVYQHSPFVQVYRDEYPKTSWVRGSNRCAFSVKMVPEQNMLVIVSVIDNLVKGASGQALQNMNIALGVPQTYGLL
jgi:N-acetyl-gamma-glutamyl-phosphate reductase